MDNIILYTLRLLVGTLVTLTVIAVALIQYLKEKWGLKDKAAEIASLVIGFVLGALVVVSYLELNGWTATVSEGIGMFLFLIVATIGPSGGYKTLRALLGSNVTDE